MAGKCHVQVERARDQEESGPDQVQAFPGGIGQLDLLFHQAADQVAAEEQACKDQRAAEQPIQHRGLPFDEDVAMQPDRGAAEDQDDGEVDPVHGLGGAARGLQPDDLQHGRRHGDARSDENVRVPIRNEEKEQRKQVEQELLHSVFYGFKRHRQGIDAVAQSGGLGAVGKDVSQVRVADVA